MRVKQFANKYGISYNLAYNASYKAKGNENNYDEEDLKEATIEYATKRAEYHKKELVKLNGWIDNLKSKTN